MKRMVILLCLAVLSVSDRLCRGREYPACSSVPLLQKYQRSDRFNTIQDVEECMTRSLSPYPLPQIICKFPLNSDYHRIYCDPDSEQVFPLSTRICYTANFFYVEVSNCEPLMAWFEGANRQYSLLLETTLSFISLIRKLYELKITDVSKGFNENLFLFCEEAEVRVLDLRPYRFGEAPSPQLYNIAAVAVYHKLEHWCKAFDFYCPPEDLAFFRDYLQTINLYNLESLEKKFRHKLIQYGEYDF